MFTWIRNWYLGYKVCKKYQLKFKPVFSSKIHGTYFYNRSVEVSILYPHFNEVLFHEIGHHIDYKLSDVRKVSTVSRIAGSKLTYGTGADGYFIYTLFCEARASRIAMRVLKSTGLVKSESFKLLTGKNAFASYVSCVPHDTLQFKTTLADLDYRLCKYIGGK